MAAPPNRVEHGEQDADDGHVHVEVRGRCRRPRRPASGRRRAAERPGAARVRVGPARSGHSPWDWWLCSWLQRAAGRPRRHHREHPGPVPDTGPARIRVIPDSQAGADGAMIGGWRQALIPGRPRAPILGPPVAQGTRARQATGPFGAGSPGHGFSPGRWVRRGTGPSSTGASGSDPLGTELLDPGRRGAQVPAARQPAPGSASPRAAGRCGAAARTGWRAGSRPGWPHAPAWTCTVVRHRLRGRGPVQPLRRGGVRGGLAADTRGGRGRQHRRQGADRPARHRPRGRPGLAARRGAGHRVGAARELAQHPGLAAGHQRGGRHPDLAERAAGRAGGAAAPG